MGHRLSERPVSARAQPALQFFSIWWYAIAAFTLLGHVGNALAAFDYTYIGIHAGLNYLEILLLVLGILALLSYLLYLFIGSLRFLPYLITAYLGFYVYMLYTYTMANPVGLNIEPWETTLTYANPLGPTTAFLFIAVLILPLLGAACAYLSLFPRVQDRTRRYRIATVSLSLILWLGSSVVASLTNLGNIAVWPLISEGLGFAAALAILTAYYPPAWLRRRGIRPIEAGEELAHPAS